MKLSDTVLAGYSDNFPVVQAKLPLKYFSTTTQSSTSSVSSSSSSSFQLNLANKGSIIPLNDIDGTVIDSVSYTLLNDLKTIRLTPLITQINRLSLKFQQIEILLPHKVSSSSCFSVYLNKDQDDSYLLVDIIDENYLFISIKVMLNDFVRNIDGKNKISQKSFQLDKFDQWGNISVPYSFELRSLPYLIRAISSKDLIVSLKDGGLLHFNRSDPLSDYQVYNFNEPTRILPFKIIESIWKKAENSQISNNSVSDKLGDVSVSSLVDLTLLTPTTFITLSINKILKIWDLTTHRLSSPPIDLKSSTSDPSLWLTASSIVKYLQVVHNGDQKYLSCHYYDSRKDQYDEGEGNVVFKLWEIIPIAEQSIELADITRHQFNPKLPNSKSSGAVWFIQDFFVTIANDIITYSILWKTNTSTIVSINNLDFINGTVTSVEWLNKSVNRSVLSTFSPYFDSNYYSDKILNSGYYNDLIVKTSLNIFRNHIGFNKDHDLSLTNLSLRQSILETIRCGEDGATERLNWYKLDSLCEEYKKLSEECLSMLPSTNVIHILNANSMCLVRQSHELETFASTFSTNQLASILNELSIIISTKTYIKIYDQILDASVALTSEKVGEIYQTFLSSKISKEDSEALIEKLINIPNILDQFNELIDLTPNQLQAEFGTIFNSDSIGGLTKLSSILSFKDIKRSHESILLGLTVLLLIMEVNDPILGLINKLSARLARYKLLNTVFDTSYSIATSSGNSNIGSFSGKVERNNISNLENSLFWQGVVSNYSVLGERINQGDLNSAYDILYSIIINDYENFITNIIIELINHDEGDLIKEIFIKNLKQDDAIDTFLIGFVYLISNDSVEFYKVFELDVFDFKDKQVKQDIKKKSSNH